METKEITVEEQKQRQSFKVRIMMIKTLLKGYAEVQKNLRHVNPSAHAINRYAITAILNWYAEYRGKEPHAKVSEEYKCGWYNLAYDSLFHISPLV